MNNLAVAYQAVGRLADAIALYEETLKLREAKLGPDHPDTLISMNNLAGPTRTPAGLADALPLLEDTLKRRAGQARARPPPHARLDEQPRPSLPRQTNPSEAEPLLRECLAIREKKTRRTTGAPSRPQPARRQPAGPEEVRRGRAALAPGLRGDEGPRSQDPGFGSRDAWPRPASGSSSSTRPGARRTRRTNGGKDFRPHPEGVRPKS